MFRTRRTWMLCFVLLVTSACDFVVKPGQTTTIGDRSAVFGIKNLNAATVLPEGTLIVNDGDLFGRAEKIDKLPAGAFPTPSTPRAS